MHILCTLLMKYIFKIKTKKRKKPRAKPCLLCHSRTWDTAGTKRTDEHTRARARWALREQFQAHGLRRAVPLLGLQAGKLRMGVFTEHL